MKILIINRSEVAKRIMNSAKSLNLKVGLISSPQDANSSTSKEANFLHVIEDRAYLNQDKILEIVKKERYDLVHPGFGFLSENSQFVEKLQKISKWVGPSSQSMKMLGDKIECKKLALQLKLPTAKFLFGKIDSSAVEKEIGFPCIVKAAAGGGGKGMKIVKASSDLSHALESAKREALNAFNSDELFVEPFFEDCYHIEVQAFGLKDKAFVLGERDCSSQRRFQKIIEEAPASQIPVSIRSQLHTIAMQLFEHAKYEGAGTVEFLVSKDFKQINLLEVNTRLQVEHGVTEMIYNCDLVSFQIMQAMDKKFEMPTNSFGHCIQVRLYAENAYSNFLPSPGKIIDFDFPNTTFIRVDQALSQGDEITGDYDPMIAKILSFGNTREEARNRLIGYLKNIRFFGPTTNRDYLLHLLNYKDFIDQKIFTRSLEKIPALTMDTKVLYKSLACLQSEKKQAATSSVQSLFYGVSK